MPGGKRQPHDPHAHHAVAQQRTHDALVAVDGLYRRFVVERQQAAG